LVSSCGGHSNPAGGECLWLKTRFGRTWVLDSLAGSWLVALTAQIEILLWPVPMTWQTFGVLLVGAVLGKQRRTLSLLAYVSQGALGFPVFAGGAGGVARLAGPTGGYLFGFVAAAFVVGWLSERGWDRRFLTAAVAMLVGNVVIYVMGLSWLANFVSREALLKVGPSAQLSGDRRHPSKSARASLGGIKQR